MLLKNLILEMPPEDLPRVEQAIDNMFRELGLDVVFTRHFAERAVETEYGKRARDEDVTAKEVFAAFNKLKNKYGQQLYDARNEPQEFEGILKDISTAINMPFSIDYDKIYKGLHKLRVKTLMRTSNFHPQVGQKVLAVK